MAVVALPQSELSKMPSDELNIDVGEAAKGETPLEEKYRGLMRQIIPQKIELPISTLPAMIKTQIELAPDFQRRNRWDVEMQSRFIESIIMNVPIPPVFLGEDDYGKYVVLDGRQRLTALHDFLRGAYALKGLAVWSELNNLRFPDLERQKLDAAITRRFVPAVIILKESSPEVKYDVFDRLNTGGEAALPMEIRNAIYRGAFTDLLHELSNNHTFRRLWDIPLVDTERAKNSMYNTMADLELVLRFFATRSHAGMNLVFKDYLTDYLKLRNVEYKAKPELAAEDTALFHRAVENSWRVFGSEAFRKPATERKSAPLADAVMAALSEVDPAAITDPKAEALRIGFHDLLTKDEAFQKAMGSGTNGKAAIKTRVEVAVALVQTIMAL
jgi:hypothetical protein